MCIERRRISTDPYTKGEWKTCDSRGIPGHVRTRACQKRAIDPANAVYRRTESMAKVREIASFECPICGETLETWNTAWVPTYRLIAGPISRTE
jgi:hypothetical protein